MGRNHPAAPLPLSPRDRDTLTQGARRATAPYRGVTRAQALLLAGAGVAPRRLATTLTAAARVTPEEHAAWQAKAEAAGVSPSRLLRQAMARTRTWIAAAEVERTRQTARVGNNFNQIARWANTHASPVDAVEMIAHLLHIVRTLDKVVRVGREPDGAC